MKRAVETAGNSTTTGYSRKHEDRELSHWCAHFNALPQELPASALAASLFSEVAAPEAMDKPDLESPIHE